MFVKYDEYMKMENAKKEEIKEKVFQNMEELNGEDAIKGGAEIGVIIGVITKLLANPAIIGSIASIVKALIEVVMKGVTALIDLIKGLSDKKKDEEEKAMLATC